MSRWPTSNAAKGTNMPARRAAKRDYSEPEIVSALEDCGVSVYRMSQPCDLLCGFRGKTYLVEAKTPGTAYGKSLNDNQTAFNDIWRGSKIVTLTSRQDAVDWFIEISARKA